MSNEFKERVAENLRVLRARKHVSGREVAELIGMSQAGYSLIENATNNLTLDRAIKIADYYGITLDELVGRS